MSCDHSLRTQAYFDGEVDAVSATQVEAHVRDCLECQALLRDFGQLRVGLRREIGFMRAPAGLRNQVLAALDHETTDDVPAGAMPAHADVPVPSGSPFPQTVQSRRAPRGYFWRGALAGVTGSALAAGLAFFLLFPPRVDAELDGLVGAHLRSMQPDHLIEVVSTDRHTVKPWFASHADVSPVVADFDSKGYRLIGGRTDLLNQQRAAVVVFQHGAHVINVFVWANDRLAMPHETLRNGFHLAFWTEGNLTYCAVSDAEWDAVMELKRLLQGLSDEEIRP